ncbi:MAG: hypothetical protein ACPGVO_02085 [Spirulinaceae cyanobacterium]
MVDFPDIKISRAPSRFIGPIDLEGTIQHATWHPAEVLPAVPGMSGSLGHDRTIPAHYRLRFEAVEVSDPAEYELLWANVVVYHPQDDGFLKAGMRIRIDGLWRAGDEGGEQTHYDRVEVLARPVE